MPLALIVVLVVSLASAACGGDSADSSATPAPPSTPTTPTPAPNPPAPGPNTVTVTLTATNGGQPLAGVAASLAGATGVTDGAGQFVASVPAATTSAVIDFSGPTIVPRRLTLATRTRAVALDAIQLAGGFSLSYYRQLVRNGMEQPGSLRALRRWTENPRIYLRTVFGPANRAVDTSSLDTVAATITSAIGEWTGGRLGVAAIERGTDTRENEPGWITVTWTEELGDGVCGRAIVAGNPGRILLHPRNEGCRCAGDPAQVSRWVIRHEVGHALGYWHTDGRDDVMFDTFNACLGALSARERLHAPILYARPNGNVDPDTDPGTAVTAVPLDALIR